MPKTLEQLEAALNQEYTRETLGKLVLIKNIGGFDYIPWNESAKLANTLFGPLGWSSSVLSCTQVDTIIQVKDRDTGEVTGELPFSGFTAIVRVTVHSLLENGAVFDTHHDGVGFGGVTAMGLKNPMDTACKAAKSDGISTAIKHFGGYFGLFLYEKPEDATTGSSAPSGGGYTTTPQAPGSAKPALSPAREGVLRNKRYPEAVISHIKNTWDIATVVKLFDDIMKNGMNTTDAMKKYQLGGTVYPEQRGKYDDLAS